MKKTASLFLAMVMLLLLCGSAFADSEPMEFVVPRHIIVPESIKDATAKTMQVPVEGIYDNYLNGQFPSNEKRWNSWNITYTAADDVIVDLVKSSKNYEYYYAFNLYAENSEETVQEYQGTINNYKGYDLFICHFNADGSVKDIMFLKFNPYEQYIYEVGDEKGWYTYVLKDGQYENEYVDFDIEPKTDLIPPVKITFTDETLVLWKKP